MKRLLVFLLAIQWFIPLLGQSTPPKVSVPDYIEKYKDIAIKKMKEHRIPASITLAQGILESSNGNSNLAVIANNHFGIKCHENWNGDTYMMDDDAKNECFRKYRSAEQSFEDHSLFLLSRPRYAPLFDLDETDYKGWASGLKKAGYATNPDYPKLLIKIIEDNRLYEFDRYGVLPFTGRNVFELKKLPSEYQKLTSNENYEVIRFGGIERKILENNGIRYTIARKNDNLERIAQELDMMPWQITRYNELGRGDLPTDGQIIYLQPKKRKAEVDYHIVKEGETIYTISQLYGVKSKFLYRKNRMEKSEGVRVGQKLWLRRRKAG